MMGESVGALIQLAVGERGVLVADGWAPYRRFKAATGWAPKVNVRSGVERLYQWLLESRGMAAPQVMTASEGFHAVFTH